MNWPTEVIEQIFSYLPVQIYNEVFGTNRPVGLYDTIPERVVIDKFFDVEACTRWKFPGASTVRVYDVEELKCMHQSLPFLPSKRIILELNDDDFLKLHKECPELLQQYKISLDAKFRLTKLLKEIPYEVVYHALELPEMVDTTTHLLVKPKADMAVAHECVNRISLFCDPSYRYESNSEAAPEEDAVFFFERINSWNVPKLSLLDIKNPGPSIKYFHYHGALNELKIEDVQVGDLPDFSSFNLKKLSLVTVGGGTIYFSLPATLDTLSIKARGDVSVLDAEFKFPENLATLLLDNVAALLSDLSDLPQGLMSLALDLRHQSELKHSDFTRFSSLKKLKLQSEEHVKVKLPPSLQVLEVHNCLIHNLQELVELEDLEFDLLKHESRHVVIDEFVLPPNLIRCQLSGLYHINTLKLNNTLRILDCGSYRREGPLINCLLTFPETLRLLSITEYSDKLDFPEGLEYLRLTYYCRNVETPKNLKCFILEDPDPGYLEKEVKLNQGLKVFDMQGTTTLPYDDPLIIPPSLEYFMVGFPDDVVPTPIGMKKIREGDYLDSRVTRRYDRYGNI